ncbi:hypothetical protein [Aliicoccus persicus]|uniref:Uncharacterized protein n=1 Tax=Aliicoccus persicus TaxID=930138 RepID=A0A662Z7J3_9STAP|nr:hypothetical protein [Aliicoccus persicus]SEW07272.1 hypothetical protein SAMN05192557_1485 [Aliicoccus persicus]
MSKSRERQASVELIQNQMILMLLMVGVISLVMLLYGIFNDGEAVAPYVETTLRITALFALIFGILLPKKLGSMKRLYQLGLLRMDIFKTYIYVALLFVLNTVTLILFIGVFINLLPILNALNSSLTTETIIAILAGILYIFGLYVAGVVLTITIKTNTLYFVLTLIGIALTLQPLISLSTNILVLIAPIILIVVTLGLLYVTLSRYIIK